MRHLGPADLRSALPTEAAIAAMRLAFGGDTELPARTLLGPSLFMAGRVGGHTGVKVVSIEPGNPAGVVAVFDEHGSPLGICDGPTLTSIRTGAACGLATDLLAAPGGGVMAMIGAGAMALDQIEAVRAVRPIDRVVVWSRTRHRAAALAERVGGTVADRIEAAVATADIITTATPSTAPLFPAEAVRPGAHVNAVGAFTPNMVELPAALLADAFVVVDDRAAAAVEAGDLIQAGIEPAATLGDVLAGRAHPPDATTTVFKTVGIASQDVAAAVAALTRAEQMGIGTLL